MIEFARSGMGRRFFEADVPRLVVALERLAHAFDRVVCALEAQALAGEPVGATDETAPGDARG